MESKSRTQRIQNGQNRMDNMNGQYVVKQNSSQNETYQKWNRGNNSLLTRCVGELAFYSEVSCLNLHQKILLEFHKDAFNMRLQLCEYLNPILFLITDFETNALFSLWCFKQTQLSLLDFQQNEEFPYCVPTDKHSIF